MRRLCAVGSVFGVVMAASTVPVASAWGDCIPLPGIACDPTDDGTAATTSAAAAETRSSVNAVTVSIASHLTTSMFGPMKGSGSGKKGSGNASVDPMTGLSGGDAAVASQGFATWGDATVSQLSNDAAATNYRGSHKVATFGLEDRFDEHVLGGVALAPDTSRLSLRSLGGHRSSTGGTFAAYGAYKFDDTYVVSSIFGYGRIANEIRTPTVSDDYQSNRFFGQINFAGAYLLSDSVRLVPSVAYTESLEAADGHHTPSTGESVKSNRIGTVKAGAQLEYAVTDMFQPFVTAAVEHDVDNSGGGSNRTGAVLGGGIQAPISEALTLGFVGTTNIGRGSQTEQLYGINIRYTW